MLCHFCVQNFGTRKSRVIQQLTARHAAVLPDEEGGIAFPPTPDTLTLGDFTVNLLTFPIYFSEKQCLFHPNETWLLLSFSFYVFFFPLVNLGEESTSKGGRHLANRNAIRRQLNFFLCVSSSSWKSSLRLPKRPEEKPKRGITPPPLPTI